MWLYVKDPSNWGWRFKLVQQTEPCVRPTCRKLAVVYFDDIDVYVCETCWINLMTKRGWVPITQNEYEVLTH